MQASNWIPFPQVEVKMNNRLKPPPSSFFWGGSDSREGCSSEDMSFWELWRGKKDIQESKLDLCKYITIWDMSLGVGSLCIISVLFHQTLHLVSLASISHLNNCTTPDLNNWTVNTLLRGISISWSLNLPKITVFSILPFLRNMPATLTTIAESDFARSLKPSMESSDRINAERTHRAPCNDQN